MIGAGSRRDNNGDYDLSGNDGSIDGFSNMWGGFTEKWNENAEWLVFKYLDSNGDQVFEDSHGIYVIWNSEGDWGYPIRLVRQDGAGGFTEVFYTQARSNIRGTFADDVIAETADIPLMTRFSAMKEMTLFWPVKGVTGSRAVRAMMSFLAAAKARADGILKAILPIMVLQAHNILLLAMSL